MGLLFFLISKFLFCFKNFQIKGKINLHVTLIYIYIYIYIYKQHKAKSKKKKKKETHTHIPTQKNTITSTKLNTLSFAILMRLKLIAD